MRNLSSSKHDNKRREILRCACSRRRAQSDWRKPLLPSGIVILRETHETPESVAHRLEIAGGRNRFGEPNYRAVWGWNRLAWIGGKFEDRDELGNLLRERFELRQEPKYPALNRWHIERWLPPEAYGTPRQWYAQTIELAGAQSVPALGPYPTRGEYEHCFALETPRGEFLQLTPTVAEHVARAIECSRRFPRSAKRNALYKQQGTEDRTYENWAYDLLDDAIPAFHRQSFVTVALGHD